MTAVDTPWRRDPTAARGRIGEWFAHAHPELRDVQVRAVGSPGGSGMSSDTLLVDLAWRDDGVTVEGSFVFRLAPDPAHLPVFPVYDLELQRRCMALVAERTTVPVPTVIAVEHDPAWLQTPFLVMRRVEGRAPADIPPYPMQGWVLDGTEAERRRMEDAAVEVLARLHALTPDVVDLGFLDRAHLAPEPIDQYLEAERRYYDWAREGVEYPLVERALSWLAAHRPESGPTTLNWGDARLGNILWRDFAPVAVLDWEMAAVGPAEIDVAWMLWLHRFFQDLTERYGTRGLPDLLRRDRVVATYEAHRGLALRDLEWYDVLAATRHAIITIRTTMRSVHLAGATPPASPDEAIHFRHLLERMLAGTYWD